VTGARKFDHITPVLHELHWLPVRQRIRFKLAMTVYKCLSGLAPAYLADDCVLVSDPWPTDGIWDLLMPGSLLSVEQEQYSAPETSQSPAQSFGTLCRQNSEFHRRLLQRLPSTWKLTRFRARTSASDDFYFALYKHDHYYYYIPRYSRAVASEMN